MIEIELISIDQIILHRIGNKSREEEINLSKSELSIDDSVKELLVKYFFSSFKSEEYYTFYHQSDLNLNEVFTFVSKIFENKNELYEQSVNLAHHLYEQSLHPKIKSGEFYVVYFKSCVWQGEELEGIGLFKSETKETFLKIIPTSDSYKLETSDGTNMNRLDKGCIILNTEKDRGYVVAVVDNLSRGNDALYWKDDFLKVKEREDNYYHTQNLMKMYKNFVTEKLPDEYEVTKADQVEMLNKSVKFMKEKDEFQLEEFTNEVITQPELIDSFNVFKKQYEEEQDLQISNEFEISDKAVKKQQRVYKSVIKLDKNFHIYIHGNREYITKGYDEKTGMHFYQLFFKEEN